MTTLGIDIGGTTIKAALVDGEAVLATARSRQHIRPGSAAVRDAIRTTVGELGPGVNQAEKVGLCAPGLLDRATKTITLSVNMPGLVGLRLDQLVADVLGREVQGLWLGTDAHAAAHDFWRASGASGRLLALSLGTGVGACVLDAPDGRPLHVSGESPGHLGQMDVSVEEPGREVPVGPDGGRGSLEAYVGVRALIARYGPEIHEVFPHLSVDEAPMRALVRAIRIAHAVYRPQHVVLLGGVGVRLSGLIPSLRSAVADGLTSVARADWTLAAGHSDFHAAAGAARLAAEMVNAGSPR